MRGGYREGAGRKLSNNKKIQKEIYLDNSMINDINQININQCNSFSKKCIFLINKGMKAYKKENEMNNKKQDNKLKFIDLFAGIGGIRLGFEDKETQCVFSSEWDKFAQKTYKANFNETPEGDITKINAADIPQHDVVLAGFPCQPFSMIGKREGFQNKTQGSLFFDVLRIIRYHQPKSFLLENVPGLLTIQNGETFNIILNSLEEVGYNVFWKVLNAVDFGLPQQRKRVIIIGFRKDLGINNFDIPENNGMSKVPIKDILEDNPEGYSISEKLQKNYLFKKDDGKPQIVDKNSTIQVKTLVATYHKIQRLTGTFVKGGPTGLRLFSKLECKRLMGFPDDFKIPVSRTQMYHQFGNSVAVPMIKTVADKMKTILRNTNVNNYQSESYQETLDI